MICVMIECTRLWPRTGVIVACECENLMKAP